MPHVRDDPHFQAAFLWHLCDFMAFQRHFCGLLAPGRTAIYAKTVANDQKCHENVCKIVRFGCFFGFHWFIFVLYTFCVYVRERGLLISCGKLNASVEEVSWKVRCAVYKNYSRSREGFIQGLSKWSLGNFWLGRDEKGEIWHLGRFSCLGRDLTVDTTQRGATVQAAETHGNAPSSGLPVESGYKYAVAAILPHFGQSICSESIKSATQWNLKKKIKKKIIKKSSPTVTIFCITSSS